jgi:serine/threonine protein kinase
VSGSQQTKLRQGDVVAKKFEIESVLGEGPVGVSYAARGVANNKKVCVKLVNGPSVGLPQASGALQRIQAARADALVPVTEVGEHNGQLWVASDYFDAESLRRLMDSYAGERKSFSLQ